MTHPLAAEGIELTTEATAAAMADGGAQVIDVREDYERTAGHVPGTRHIELAQLSSEARTIDPERPVIFQCRVGSRSLMAAQAFRRAGYEAYSMAGGVQRWADEDRPLEPADGHVAPH